MKPSTVRWAGIVGLIAIAVILVSAFMSGQPPSADDPVGDVREFVVDNRDALLAGVLLQLVAFPLVAWFIVVVRGVLASGDDSAFPTVALASTFVLGGIVQVAGAVGGGVLLNDGFAETASDDVIQFVWSASNLLYAVGATAMVALMGSFGISALRGRTFPVWLGWLSLVTAVVALVSYVSVLDSELGDLAFLGLIGFTVWIVATSIVLLGAGGRAERPARPAPAAA